MTGYRLLDRSGLCPRFPTRSGQGRSARVRVDYLVLVFNLVMTFWIGEWVLGPWGVCSTCP